MVVNGLFFFFFKSRTNNNSENTEKLKNFLEQFTAIIIMYLHCDRDGCGSRLSEQINCSHYIIFITNTYYNCLAGSCADNPLQAAGRNKCDWISLKTFFFFYYSNTQPILDSERILCVSVCVCVGVCVCGVSIKKAERTAVWCAAGRRNRLRVPKPVFRHSFVDDSAAAAEDLAGTTFFMLAPTAAYVAPPVTQIITLLVSWSRTVITVYIITHELSYTTRSVHAVYNITYIPHVVVIIVPVTTRVLFRRLW